MAVTLNIKRNYFKLKLFRNKTEIYCCSEGFELPADEVLARRKVCSVRFILKHFCVEDAISVNNSDTTWFRLSPFIQAFS